MFGYWLGVGEWCNVFEGVCVCGGGETEGWLLVRRVVRPRPDWLLYLMGERGKLDYPTVSMVGREGGKNWTTRLYRWSRERKGWREKWATHLRRFPMIGRKNWPTRLCRCADGREGGMEGGKIGLPDCADDREIRRGKLVSPTAISNGREILWLLQI